MAEYRGRKAFADDPMMAQLHEVKAALYRETQGLTPAEAARRINEAARPFIETYRIGKGRATW